MKKKASVSDQVFRAALVLIVLGVLAGFSREAGHPTHLPGISLGWLVLFYVERSAALLAVIGAVVLVGWRALCGEFPSSLGNVGYAATEAAQTQSSVDILDTRIKTLEVFANIIPVEDGPDLTKVLK
jgi:hypothetical protein